MIIEAYSRVLRAYCNRNSVTVHIRMHDVDLWTETEFKTLLLDDTCREATLLATFPTKTKAADVCASIITLRNEALL